MKKPVLCIFAAMLALAVLVSGAQAAGAKKVFILAIDGMDPKLLGRFREEGMMPNFDRLIAQGDFKPLQTSAPPQSPVAWSTFITGADPGVHGIFDFVHRDPSGSIPLPYMSMSEATAPERSLKLGSWVLPLEQGEVKQLRKGKAFWQLLDEQGVPTTIFRMPANFPPVETSGKSFSGMGTPDILGSPGTFSYFTTSVPESAEVEQAGKIYKVQGGKVYKVSVEDHVVKARLRGPKNPFRRVEKESRRKGVRKAKKEYKNPVAMVDFEVALDPDQSAARFFVQDQQFVLKEGEWSDWIPVSFEMVPWLVGADAIGRFYLQEVYPEFKLYVSPLQISPENPAMPITTPESWAQELYENLGYFYTQGLPAETNALSSGLIDGWEFWQQSELVHQERLRALDYILDNFHEGLTYFYFSTLDQGTHMLWRYVDEEHPAFNAEERLVHSIGKIYQEADEALGRVMERIDEDTVLIVMSDHGFAPFYWGVNLNSWLVEKGYVTLKRPSRQGEYELFMNVDWKRTKAYGLGLNGLYVNLKGREKNGIVPEEQYEEILDQLEQDLLAMRDPRNGRQPVSLVTRTHRDFHGDEVEIGPDIIVGYNWGYRVSWESPLGEFPKEVFVDNIEPWSGDHCVDYRVTPGVLITNQNITMDKPALYDLTVAVLDEYGVKPLPEMIGQDCLASGAGTQVAADAAKGVRGIGYTK
jgi:predicted AlkP superfamily phosphohydrolase/phosphomutase